MLVAQAIPALMNSPDVAKFWVPKLTSARCVLCIWGAPARCALHHLVSACTSVSGFCYTPIPSHSHVWVSCFEVDAGSHGDYDCDDSAVDVRCDGCVNVVSVDHSWLQL